MNRTINGGEYYGASYIEGFDAYYAGQSRKNCPYPATDEKVEGTGSLTCRMLRENWLEGWDIASNELIEEV